MVRVLPGLRASRSCLELPPTFGARGGDFGLSFLWPDVESNVESTSQLGSLQDTQNRQRFQELDQKAASTFKYNVQTKKHEAKHNVV